MKIILFVFLLSCSIFAQKQKIAVKKGMILIDKVEIPVKVDSEFNKVVDGNTGDFHQILSFTDVKTSNLFVIVEYKGKLIGSTGLKETWFEISDAKKNKTNSVDIEREYGAGKKGLIRHLINKYQFFNKEGIVNEQKIIDFLDSETISKAKIKANVANAVEGKVIESRKIPITVDYASKAILSQDEKIGFFQTGANNTLVIGDLDNKKIATASINPLKRTVDVQSKLLEKGFSYRNPSTSLIDKDGESTIKFVKELVHQLHSKGITLGHQAAEQKSAAYQNRREERSIAFEKAKTNSTNIYEKKGYAINEKGVRFEGNITMLFEQVNDANDVISSGSSNVGDGGIGSSVTVFYQNEKGKSKSKSVSAKNNANFCVTNDNGIVECYKALKVTGGPIISSTDGPLALTSSKGKFLKEIFKDGNLIVYQYPPTKTFYLKIKNKEKAFNFTIPVFGKKEKKANKLKEYLNGCDYTDKHEYVEDSFKELATIKELINYYNTSCK